MAYICKLQPRPGALILEKCVDFGVPPGPLLGKLKSGEDVTLASGVVVKASDVCEPDDPGPVFIGEVTKNSKNLAYNRIFCLQ